MTGYDPRNSASSPLGVLGWVVATIVVLALIGATWEGAFAVAVALYSKSWALWSRFVHGELLLPAQTAIAEWRNPTVHTLVGRATLGTVAVLVLVVAGLMQLVQQVRGARPPKGAARLATATDLKKADLFDGRPGYSIFLGRFSGKDVRYSGPSHIYVNGPTRAGKGVGFVLPNALEWRGSLIGLDIKREMWNQIGAARAQMGQRVFLFAPGTQETHRWNPLDLVAPWPARATDVSNIARSLIAAPATGDAYWAETARGLFAGLLAYVLDSEKMEGRRTIKSALNMFSRGEPLATVMANILLDEPDLNTFVKDKFAQHIGREPKQRMSFEAHVTTALDAWNNSLVDDATAASDFNIADLRRKPFTILIATPVGDFGSVEAVIRLLIQQVHDVLLRSLPAPDEPHKLLLMLDEFYQFGRMPEIVDRAPLVAGYGFQIAIIAQGLTQLDVRYGKPTRDMLVGNMDVKLFVGVGDEVTAKYGSEEVGQHFVRREGWGQSTGQGFGGRGSRSIQGRWELEPLITSEGLRRLDGRKSLLLVRGQYAAILDKVNFFLDAKYKRAAKESAAVKSAVLVPHLQSAGTVVEAVGSPAPSLASAIRHEAAIAAVMREARELFEDVAEFERAFLSSMQAVENAVVAELCSLLRTNPGKLGQLRPLKRTLRPRIVSLHARTLALRAEIIAARQALNNERAEQSQRDPSVVAPVGAQPDGRRKVDSSSDETAPSIGAGRALNGTAGGATTGSSAEAETASKPLTETAVGSMAEASAEKVLALTKKVESMLPALDGQTQGLISKQLNLLVGAAPEFVDTADDLAELMPG